MSEEIKDKLKVAYMKVAETFAECSSATRLKVGAVLIKDTNIISFSYNGTPSGYPTNDCEDANGNTKEVVIHAETNLLIKLCSQGGVGAKDSIMFITHSPCFNCSKLIYQSGIKKVYYKHKYRCTDGLDFLQEMNIPTEQLICQP